MSVLSELRKPVKPVLQGIDTTLLNSCRHALRVSHEAYCTLRRENTDKNICEGCPNFNAEPLEYRLFRRM